VHACADFATSQLWLHWTSEGSSEFAKAADACGTLEEAKKSYNELFRGLCTERGKGKSSKNCSEGIRGLETLQMSRRGCCHRHVGKRGKAGRISGNAQIVGMRVWGAREMLLVLSGALLRVQPVLQRISARRAYCRCCC
jgi:hypothetical protein